MSSSSSSQQQPQPYPPTAAYPPYIINLAPYAHTVHLHFDSVIPATLPPPVIVQPAVPSTVQPVPLPTATSATQTSVAAGTMPTPATPTTPRDIRQQQPPRSEQTHTTTSASAEENNDEEGVTTSLPTISMSFEIENDTNLSHDSAIQRIHDRLRQSFRNIATAAAMPPPPPRGVSLLQVSQVTRLGLASDFLSFHDDGSTDERCSICQDTIRPYSIVRKVRRCNHIFHFLCIEHWLQDHQSCPVCMQNVLGNDDNTRRDATRHDVADDEEVDVPSLEPFSTTDTEVSSPLTSARSTIGALAERLLRQANANTTNSNYTFEYEYGTSDGLNDTA